MTERIRQLVDHVRGSGVGKLTPKRADDGVFIHHIELTNRRMGVLTWSSSLQWSSPWLYAVHCCKARKGGYKDMKCVEPTSYACVPQYLMHIKMQVR